MTVTLEESKNKLVTMVIAYGPCENEASKVKDSFYEDLQRELEGISTEVIIVGDLNARVGNDPTGFGQVVGKHGEPHRNNNGKRLLQLCLANDLVILNTKFPHKDVHKYTRVSEERDENSIIDYIIVQQLAARRVRDTRVKRGFDIDSDHRLLIMTRTTETGTAFPVLT
ncbi:hypothetical protein ACDI60_27250, partial [Klebsiella pneumoniae]|uniref:hypothetical protein n=1 Tax=Klebsiella pneumoniae TaxID=573 RepID=UPI003532039F